MKKRFLSLLLATMMVFSLWSTTVFATETKTNPNDSSPVPIADFLEPDVTTTHVNGFTVEDVALLDLSGIDSSNIIELPDSEVAVHAVSSESESASALNNENVAFDVNLSNLENAESLDDSIILSSPITRTSAYTMASMSNVMGEGEAQHLYTITVSLHYCLQVLFVLT